MQSWCGQGSITRVHQAPSRVWAKMCQWQEATAAADLYRRMLGLRPHACLPSTVSPANADCNPSACHKCSAYAASVVAMRPLSRKAYKHVFP